MRYQGSCHCGSIKFSVEGDLKEAMECNCSHCSRKGYLLWFVPADRFTLGSGEGGLATYTFNKQVIKHRFCPTCGCAPFASGKDREGKATAAVNVRCLEGVDLAGVKLISVDGRKF
jgi:hypothetical protein